MGAAVAKQLSLYDLRDEHAEPVLDDGLRVVGDEPHSIRELTDWAAGEGKQWSGQQRARVTADVHDALWQLYVHAWAIFGEERAAAVILLRVCARDRAFDPPEWLRGVWEEYQDELVELFHRDDVGRETDYSEGGDDARETWSLTDVPDARK